MKEEISHYKTPLLDAVVDAGLHAYLYGPTGTGKTHAAYKMAKSRNLPFSSISVCPATTQSALYGYNDANGKYNKTSFRDIYENGGVFCLDEMDNGNPSILAALNTALSNGFCTFPDGKTVWRHEKTTIIVTANTIGRGADINYVGRSPIDAATLDRFVFIKWDLDEELEKSLIDLPYKNRPIKIEEGGTMEKEVWYEWVKLVRDLCEEMGLRHIVSPRATEYGERLLRHGVGAKHVLQMCLWKGLPEGDRKKVIEGVKKRWGVLSEMEMGDTRNGLDDRVEPVDGPPNPLARSVLNDFVAGEEDKDEKVA